MKLFFNLLFIILLFGCSKEEPLTKINFKVGKIEENSIYKKFDPEFQIIGIDKMKDDNILVNNNHDSIDVDNDGIFDIGIETVKYIQHINMDVYSSFSSIYCINSDFQIAMTSINDWYSYTDSLTSDTVKVYNTDKPDSYSMITDWSEIEYYKPIRPIEFKSGAMPDENTEWNIESRCYMSYRDSSYYYRTVEPLLKQYDDYTYGTKGVSEFKYIVFRKLDTKCYYGWIKLRITDFNKISIYESYFQNDAFEY